VHNRRVMSALQISAIALGMGLCTLPAAAFAQSNEKGEATPAAASISSTGNAGQVSAQSWTTATAETPAVDDATPSARPTTPAPSAAPASTSPQPAKSTLPVTASSTGPSPSDATSTSDEPVTLFGHRNVKFGGYGAFGARYARVNGENGAFIGGEGAFLIDHRLAIGAAGYGWSNERRMPVNGYVGEPYMHLGYGGLLVRYQVIIPQSPVAISVATLVGGGAVGFTANRDGQLRNDNYDAFFIVEPQLGTHVYLTRWMRLGVDAGYRIVSGVNRFGFTESNFRGASVGGSIGFGYF